MYSFEAMAKNPHHGSSVDEWFAEEESRSPGFIQDMDERVARKMLAATMKKARTDAGLTQGELAKKIGTTQSSIARSESGDVMPSSEMLLKVANALSCALHVKLIPRKKGARARRG